MRFESSNVQLAAAEKLQADAKAAVRKGNYTAAIEKLTEAIDMKPLILMNLLDMRAAIYDKTNNLKTALKDAKTMMGHQKTNPKGYLRAGKILHRLDKADLAIEIYRHGLKHVEASDPQRPQLEGLLKQAIEKQSQAMKEAADKIHDPMTVLPLELLEMILSYVPFQTIVAMQRVSKNWQRVISGNPRFWTTLDFSQSRKPVSKTALKNCISKSKYTLTKAVLNRIHNFNDTTLIDMVSMCKDLEYMKVMDGFMGSSLTRAMQLTKSLRTLILHCQIPFTTLEGLINPEVPLEHLEVRQLGPTKNQILGFSQNAACVSLRRLLLNFAVMDAAQTQRKVALEELVALIPNIQELQLNKIQSDWTKLDLRSLEKLETFVCRGSTTHAEEILYPASLKVLDLSGTTFTQTSPNTAENQETLTNLQTLNLTKSTLPANTLLDLVPPYDNRLTHLRIGWAKCIGFEHVVDNYLKRGSLSALEELSVEGDYECTNKSLTALYNLPSLKRLNFSLTSVSGSGVYQLLLYGKCRHGSLKEVILNGTDGVSGELIKYAKDLGVKIVQAREGGRDWQLLQAENSAPFSKI